MYVNFSTNVDVWIIIKRNIEPKYYIFLLKIVSFLMNEKIFCVLNLKAKSKFGSLFYVKYLLLAPKI